MRTGLFIVSLMTVMAIVACSDNHDVSASEPHNEHAGHDHAHAMAPAEMDLSAAEANYQQYCALCHGQDREGYANDRAPSLQSQTLFVNGPVVPYMATAYGRPGTPMGPYLDEVGGPMSEGEIRELTIWLGAKAGVESRRPRQDDLVPIRGDLKLGQTVYETHCASCHGAKGEGGEGTALGNVTMLATTPDSFLKTAIKKGREGTAMEAYDNRLSESEIDSVVTFLRSRASGWDVADMQFAEPPDLDQVVINPDGPAPRFDLANGLYVSANALNEAIQAGSRLILIDTRVPYFWAMAHIEGSLPIPYYSSGEEIIAALPNDGTWIVAYCECPRAAAESAVHSLRALGYRNTAVLYEGYAGWAALGHPVSVGTVK